MDIISFYSLVLFAVLIHAHDPLHYSFLSRDEAQRLGGAGFVDAGQADVPLHGFQVSPPTNLHDHRCRNAGRNELCREAGPQGVEFHRGQPVCDAETAKDFGLLALVFIAAATFLGSYVLSYGPKVDPFTRLDRAKRAEFRAAQCLDKVSRFFTKELQCHAAQLVQTRDHGARVRILGCHQEFHLKSVSRSESEPVSVRTPHALLANSFSFFGF